MEGVDWNAAFEELLATIVSVVSVALAYRAQTKLNKKMEADDEKSE